MFLKVSTQIPKPLSLPTPPAWVTHCQIPSEFIFPVKISSEPKLVRVYVPNVPTFSKHPVIQQSPALSIVIAFPSSSPVPPDCVTQSQTPKVSTFAIKISLPP